MANRSMANRKTSPTSRSSLNKIFENPKIPFSLALILADSLLVALIIIYVPYTKIDWDAYMSQVSGFLGGERDYSKLEGDTGPLVYPAGFLYIYSAIQFITGGQVYPAQILFGFLYIANLGMVLLIYWKTDVVPWWALSLLCFSKRVHSIFILRLFNDCFAMTLFHASLVSVLYNKWPLGLIIFSGAVSVKMNVLLYAPPLLLLMFKAMNFFGVVSALAGAAIVQILLGLPFIISYPISYVSRAFNLGRVFIHFWSVNFKFVPEQIFISKMFALSLLFAHLILLAVFANYKWSKYEGGILSLLHAQMVQLKFKYAVSSFYPLKRVQNKNLAFKVLQNEHIVTTMFVGNFIGIVCARSLHYQFYSWYFFTLPYLLWKTPFPTFLRLIMFAGVEFCWNVFPSNSYSSFLLLCIHLLILWGLWIAPTESPYVDDNSKIAEKRE